MEYINIYNEKGEPLGKKLREEVHDKGFWHKAVHIWIINKKGELLIQKRSPLVINNPNKWDISVAGHIPAGEDNLTAAVRETREEIGLSFPPEEFIYIGTVEQISSRNNYINKEINPVYIVKMDSGLDKIKKQEEEVVEVRFISKKELQQSINNNDNSFVMHPEEYKLLFRFLK
jgi:isopentenyldiphosphate isomerase